MSIPVDLTPAEKLLASLGAVTIFDSYEYAGRLQAAILSTPQMTGIASFFTKPNTPQSGCLFDGVDCTDRVVQLGIASAAAAIPKLDDPRGFQHLANSAAADQVPISYIQQLMTPIYAQHVNEQLARDELDPLQILYKDATLVQGFQQKVTSIFFDPFGQRPDYHYAMTVLFVYEYFARGPDFVMPTNPQDLHARDVVRAWNFKAALESQLSDQAVLDATKVLSFALSGIYNPAGRANVGLGDYAFGLVENSALFNGIPESVASSSPVSTILSQIVHHSIFDDVNIEQYQAVSYRLWNVWQSQVNDSGPTGFWVSGIRSAEAQVTDIDEDNGYDPYHVHRTTIYGKDLMDWVSANANQSYMNKGVSVNNTEHHFVYKKHKPTDGGESASCFIAGTKILTVHGPTNIEQLATGAQVLTRAEPIQWGVLSNELVRFPAPKQIYGFNGSQAFFTAGHVFFTSTGLRAVDPMLARRENPWIEVGKLRAGHHLVQTVNGEEYTNVEITSIDPSPCQDKYVYGVHLREGLRSYHANGYLTAVNYPEITVSSIGEQLNSLPSKEKLRVLSHFKELSPLLGRFGGQTVLEALERETNTKSIYYGGKASERHPFLLRDLTMPYVLQCRDSKAYRSSLELYNGVLYIDGKYCEHASFNADALAWSRKLSDDIWEHAYCKFYYHGKQAKGWLAHAGNPPGSAISDLQKPMAFRLLPGCLGKLPKKQRVRRNQFRRPETRTIAPREEVHKGTSVRENGEWVKVASKVRNNNDTQSEVKALKEDDVERITWNLQYDEAAYDPSKPVSTWKPNVTIGTVSVDVDEDEHIDFASMRFDKYDQVREALINHSKIEQSDTQKLDLSSMTDLYDHEISYDASMTDLYDHEISYDASNMEHHTFTLGYAEAILVSSDEFKQWVVDHPDYLDLAQMPPIKNLHFTNIGMGSSFSLPLLMQTVKIQMLPGDDRMVGIIRQYDNYADGQNGTPHYMAGLVWDQTTMSLRSAMVAPHEAMASASRSPLQAHREALPAAFAMADAGLGDTDDTVDDLAKVSYSQSAVNQAVQSLMSGVMQWHMDESERKTFFGTSQPTGLPHQFTTDIVGSPTAKWLKETYARAYIGQILTQQDGQIRDSLRFTAQEKKNIRYFWNGKGEECLSRSQIYKDLERGLTRWKIRDMYKEVATAFNDQNGQGGVFYSNALVSKFTTPLGLAQVCQVDPNTGSTMLTKLAAIMDALDQGATQTWERKYNPDTNSGILPKTLTVQDTNSNQLTFKVLGYQSGKTWKSPYWAVDQAAGDSAANEYLQEQWLQDTLIDIVTALIENDQNFEADVLNTMGKDIESFGKQQANWAELSAKQKSQLVVAAFGNRLYKFVQGMGYALGWVKTAGGWVLDKGKRLVASWRKGSSRIGDAAEKAVEAEPPPNSISGPLMKSCFFILGLTALGVSIWNCTDKWSTSNTADRGLMISSIFAAFRQATVMGVDAMEAIVRYRTGVVSDAVEQSLQNTFDEIMSQIAGDDIAVLEPSATTPLLAVPKRSFAVQVELARDLQNNEGNLEPLAEGEEPGFIDILEAIAENVDTIVKFKAVFNVARAALQIFGYVISIAVAIFMTWQLVQNWSSMDTGHKVFQSIQTALALVEAAASLFMLGANVVAWGAGALAGWEVVGAAFAASAASFVVAATTIFVAFAIVIAVIAIIALVAFFIWESKQDPPLNDVEKWMQNTGLDFASSQLTTAPELPCNFYYGPQSFTSNRGDNAVQSIGFGFANPTSSTLDLEYLQVSFQSGSEESCLFWDQLDYTDAHGQSSPTQGQVAMISSNTNSEAVMNIINHPSDVQSNDVTQTNVSISGPAITDSSTGLTSTILHMGPGETIAIHAYGRVFSDTQVDCFFSAEQAWVLDDLFGMMLLHRVVFVVLSLCLRAKTLDCYQGDGHFHPVANANHIFNTILSSMRQWGSSLNHNGMSLFPAIVPQGTILHHGTSMPDAVTGMEWVAFERDHALHFAHLYLTPTPGPRVPGVKNVEKVYPDKNSLISFRNKQHILHAQRQPRNSDPVWILPGYLHSYLARKDLRLLYLDGSAAATTNKGTLDVSDLLLLNNSQMMHLPEPDRARRLCQIAAKDWGGRIDGFVRMEAGFEIIICSFAKSLHFVEALRAENIDHGGKISRKENAFHWLRAVAARYNGIGGSPPRVQLNYNTFLTAYAYPLDVFQNASTALPRLIAAPQNILEDMRSDLKSIILRSDSSDKITHSSCNWQAVADMIVQKYANPLQYLVTSSEFSKSSTRLAQELNYMLRPFFDTLNRDAAIETKRCAAEFMPLDFHSSDSHDYTGNLSGRAIYTVSYRICSTLINALWSLEHPSSSSSSSSAAVSSEDKHTHHLTTLRDLTSYLAWTEWKKCRGCSWNEICSIPMFPFGVAEDHERPRCRSVENFGELGDYWDDTQSEND